MSPFHVLLAMIAILPYTVMRLADGGIIGTILLFVLYLNYSYRYYLRLSSETNQTILEVIKEDFPTFSKIDMKPWQFMLFLLIAAPFLLFFGSIIVAFFR